MTQEIIPSSPYYGEGSPLSARELQRTTDLADAVEKATYGGDGSVIADRTGMSYVVSPELEIMIIITGQYPGTSKYAWSAARRNPVTPEDWEIDPDGPSGNYDNFPAREINNNTGVPLLKVTRAWVSNQDGGMSLDFDAGAGIPGPGDTINYIDVTINYIDSVINYEGDTIINYGGSTTTIFNGAIYYPGGTFTTFTTNINNLSLTGTGNVRLRVSADAHYREITGIAPGLNPAGRIVCLHNVGDFVIILPHNSTDSFAPNRIQTTTGNDYFLAGGHEVTLWYDEAIEKWRVSENSDERLGKLHSYADWTTNQTDWAIQPDAGFHQISSTSDVDISGIARPKPGLRHVLANVGEYIIILKHDDATSSADNRFYLPKQVDMKINPGVVVEVVYDGSSARWRPIAYRDIFVEKQSVYGGVEGVPTSSADWTREMEGRIRQSRDSDVEDEYDGHPELMFLRRRIEYDNLQGGEIVGAVRGYGPVNDEDEVLGSFQVRYVGIGSFADGRAEIYGSEDGFLNRGFQIHPNGQGEFDTANTPNYLLGTDGLGRVIVVDPDSVGGGGGGGGGGGNCTCWQKFTFTYADFTAADFSESILLYTMQPGQILHAVFIKHSESFHVTGLSFTLYELSVGVSGNPGRFINAFDAEQPVSETAFAMTTGHTGLPVTDDTGGWDVELYAETDGHLDLEDGDTGSVDVWLLLSTLDGGGDGGTVSVTGIDGTSTPISVTASEIHFDEESFVVEEPSPGVAHIYGSGGGGGGGAPLDAKYVVLELTAGLTDERVLTGTANQITITDLGPNDLVKIGTPQDIHTGCDFVSASLTTGYASVTNDGGLRIRDTNDSHYTRITTGSNLTVNRTLLIVTGDSDRTLTLTDDASIEGTNTGDQHTFFSIAVAGQPTIYATAVDSELTLVAGANITLVTDATAKTVTISSTGGGGGGLSDGNYGDVTVSGSSTVISINTGVVGTVKIANGAVTFVKMQPVSTNVLLGNDGTGSTVQEIPCTQAGRDLISAANATTQRSVLGLGTAAVYNVGDFATASQGLLADSSLQPSDIGVYVQAYDLMLDLLSALSDPGGDRIAFWDESSNSFAWLQLGTNLSITGTTLNATGGGGSVPDGDYGDVVVSGGGTIWTINDDATDTPQLVDGAVTTPKIAPAAVDQSKLNSSVLARIAAYG